MSNVKLTAEESRCLTILKGVAILLVLFIHVDLRPKIKLPDNVALDIYYHALTRVLSFNAVPMFFFISGFLFFLKSDTYINKWRKRVKSLLVPYLCWCLVGFLIPFVFQVLLGLDNLYTGNKIKLIKDFGLIDYLRMFWDIRDEAPILSTMWFLRDLIVMVLLTPVIWWLIHKLKYLFPVLISLMYLFVEIPVQGLATSGLFFFSLGCFFASYYGLDPINRVKWPLLLSLWLVSFVSVLWTYAAEASVYKLLLKVFLVINSVAFYKFVYYFSTKSELKFLLYLSGISFFIYAFHEPWLGYAINLTFKYAHPQGWILYVLPFAFVLFAVCFSYVAYLVLERVSPRLLGILTGSRTSDKRKSITEKK